MNKYHLHVYKLSHVVLDNSDGMNVSIKLKEIWDAPFKDEESLMKSFLDHSERGFVCRVVKK